MFVCLFLRHEMQFRWSALIKIGLCRKPHQNACIYILVSWNRRNPSFMYPNAALNLIYLFFFHEFWMQLWSCCLCLWPRATVFVSGDVGSCLWPFFYVELKDYHGLVLLITNVEMGEALCGCWAVTWEQSSVVMPGGGPHFCDRLWLHQLGSDTTAFYPGWRSRSAARVLAEHVLAFQNVLLAE